MKNLIVLKKKLSDKFQDFNSEKLINLLSVLDCLHILFITQNCQDVQVLTNVLRDEFFILVKEKMEDESILLFYMVGNVKEKNKIISKRII